MNSLDAERTGRRPVHRLQLGVKYVLDRFAAILLLIALAPILLVIALAVKLEDGGPALFRQGRAGLHGRTFRICKFRTMVVDADRYLDARGRTTGVDRITRVGRVLRAFSLDELPQLVNIARGEMSFIGPRPVLPDHLQRYDAAQMERFAMRPGVTGLAQINGRNTLRWSRRLAYDLEYVRGYSLRLDAVILLRTIPVVFRSEGVVLDRNPEDVDDLPPARKHEDDAQVDRLVNGETA